MEGCFLKSWGTIENWGESTREVHERGNFEASGVGVHEMGNSVASGVVGHEMGNSVASVVGGLEIGNSAASVVGGLVGGGAGYMIESKYDFLPCLLKEVVGNSGMDIRP